MNYSPNRKGITSRITNASKNTVEIKQQDRSFLKTEDRPSKLHGIIRKLEIHYCKDMNSCALVESARVYRLPFQTVCLKISFVYISLEDFCDLYSNVIVISQSDIFYYNDTTTIFYSQYSIIDGGEDSELYRHC